MSPHSWWRLPGLSKPCAMHDGHGWTMPSGGPQLRTLLYVGWTFRLPHRSLLCLVMFFLFLCNGFLPGRAFPLSTNEDESDEAQMEEYLTRFGYLPKADAETGALRTPDTMADALRTLQRFGNIPETGRMDSATKSLMNQPRCGMADIIDSGTAGKKRKKRYALQGGKWEYKDLTYSIRDYTKQLDEDHVRRALYDAFQVWQLNSQLAFREISPKSPVDADIVIRFAKGYHDDHYRFDRKGKVLAHAFYPGGGRGGDLHFDDDEEWTVGGDFGVSLFAVASHEVGHSVGLSHSPDPNALMYPYYREFSIGQELPIDDVKGVHYLYGKPDRPGGAGGPRRVPTTTTTTTTTTPRPTTSQPPTVAGKPDICHGGFDAVSVIRREIYFFKGTYFWRTENPGHVDEDKYPVKISTFWYGLGPDVEHIDALYERQDGKIMIFSGDSYWRLNEDQNFIEPEYPYDIQVVWRGVPYDVSAAFRWQGTTFFFKGDKFYKFSDINMAVDEASRDGLHASSFWFGCPETVQSVSSSADGAATGSFIFVTLRTFLTSIAAILLLHLR